MPPKIRELRSDLRKAGFKMRQAKGSHNKWSHPEIPDILVLSGNDGDDAKPYQERDVRRALQKLKDVRRRQP